MKTQKIETFGQILHVMIYGLGSAGAVLFAAMAYLEGWPL